MSGIPAIIFFVRCPPQCGWLDIGSIIPEVGIGYMATGDIKGRVAAFIQKQRCMR
jgi:hypothetical protein